MADNNNKNNLEVCNNKYVFTKRQKAYLPLKRFIGICGSFVGIIVCAILLWWWVLIVNTIVTKGHPIFIQERIGKNKKAFGLIKFRSMKLSANPNLAPSAMNEAYQESLKTPFGKFLRKSSIDETLQLLNIFVGQMAFIGPRPGAAHNEEELIKLREAYIPNAYDVRPGLGGYAQYKMHREHNPELKAKYDSEYVSHISLGLDIKLFFDTVCGVFRSESGK